MNHRTVNMKNNSPVLIIIDRITIGSFAIIKMYHLLQVYYPNLYINFRVHYVSGPNYQSAGNIKLKRPHFNF